MNDSNDQPPPALDLGQLMKRLNVEGDRKYPPVHLWEPDFCGDLDIRIARDGTWFYLGTPIGRMPMVKLFSSVLRHDEDGRHYLVTPVEKIGITVDVAPLLITEMERSGSGKDQVIGFRTLVDDFCTLDDDHPLSVSIDPETGEPTPLVLVRDRLQGLIRRVTFYEMVDISEEMETEHGPVYGVWSAGKFHIIGRTDGRPLEDARP